MRGVAAALALLLAAPAVAEPVAIVHARAWTMTGPAPVEDATVVIDGGRVVSVAPHGRVPAGARTIDAKGRPVTPGLMHGATQLGLAEVLGATETDDRRAKTGPLGTAFDVQYAINPASETITQARADGLTRALDFPDAGGASPFAGMAALLHLIPGGEVLERPRAAMFVTVGGDAAAQAGGSRAVQWGVIRNALHEARAFAAQPAHGAPRDQLLDRPDVEALTAVTAGTVPLAIVTDRESDIRQAIRLAAEERVRVIVVGGAEAWKAAGALATARIPVVLDPMQDLPTSFDALGSRLDNAAILAKAGVPIAFSVSGNGIYLSYNAGLALREGAGIAVSHGLPYVDALHAITDGAARIWGAASGSGTLTPGSEADIVVWDGDPLEPASAPVAVFIGGVEASLVTRQTLLRDRYASGDRK